MDKKPEILVVDDEPNNLRLVNEILKKDYKLYLAPSGAYALEFLKKRIPNLILMDVLMPNMDGYEVMRRIKGNEAYKNIPVIFLTGLEGRDNEQAALDMGAVDYVLKPIAAGILTARIGLHIELEKYRKHLEEEVDIRTSQLLRTQDAVLSMLAKMTEVRDNDTGTHIKRTTSYTRMLVDHLKQLDIPNYRIEPTYGKNIINAAKLHDIGKIAVGDEILLKTGKLTPEEFDRIKQHTVYGAQVIDEAISDLGDSGSFLAVAREIIISHHEKWDGSGYPHQLKGEEIPLSGRIMAIADVYDALITQRPYKPAFTHEVAIETIFNEAGTHFDPYLVEYCKDVITAFKDVSDILE
ncbi:response regulator [Porphyromonadaceae bacterium OttesenSCG-928-L07]|nr:response regulator [Porphyromonadaceae bacterium OttesenSCG-928-L07]MDL2251954.1 response regulator [Odoribacter sp. OttesenSCG-928-J03]MDL2283285.1 response regulator [Odoribacter sp. OttesenSCG-928-G04]